MPSRKGKRDQDRKMTQKNPQRKYQKERQGRMRTGKERW